MSRIKEWLGSDISFEDAETSGTDSTPEQPTQPTDADYDEGPAFDEWRFDREAS